MLLLITIFVASALITISLIAVLNALTFSRLSASDAAQRQQTPMISILIPARNEYSRIQQRVQQFLQGQAYSNFELLVLDDNSTDGTGDLARAAGEGDTRLRVITGKPLPPGWMGKNWACQQLAEEARGEVLIFTDADVEWQRGAIDSVVNKLAQTNADLLTVWPTQKTITWAERLTVPAMALVVNSYLPLLAVHHLPFAAFAAACGQCMIWQREAYEAIGGHAAVRDNVLEDVTMARLVKRAGYRLHMTDGANVINCRMYQNWSEVLRGYGKNILAGYGNSIVLLLLATAFHWLLFVFPFALLFISGYFAWGAALVTLSVGVRMLTAAMTRQRLADALLMPLTVLLFTRIAIQAVYWQRRYGGPQWKGRTIQRQQKPF